MQQSIKLFLILPFFLLYSNVNGQLDSSHGPNVIKVQGFGFFGGQFQFSYERLVKSKVKPQITMGFGYFASSDNDDNLNNRSIVYTVIPELRYYLEDDLIGPYFSAYTLYKITERIKKERIYNSQNNTYTRKTYDRDTQKFSFGLLIGYQTDLYKTVVVEGFLGPEFMILDVERNYSLSDYQLDDDNPNNSDGTVNLSLLQYNNDYVGLSFRAGISIGIVF